MLAFLLCSALLCSALLCSVFAALHCFSSSRPLSRKDSVLQQFEPPSIIQVNTPPRKRWFLPFACCFAWIIACLLFCGLNHLSLQESSRHSSNHPPEASGQLHAQPVQPSSFQLQAVQQTSTGLQAGQVQKTKACSNHKPRPTSRRMEYQHRYLNSLDFKLLLVL
mgnify:CR=1 FL=1